MYVKVHETQYLGNGTFDHRNKKTEITFIVVEIISMNVINEGNQ